MVGSSLIRTGVLLAGPLHFLIGVSTKKTLSEMRGDDTNRDLPWEMDKI